jgi:Acetyltransferase (GNAT) domain
MKRMIAEFISPQDPRWQRHLMLAKHDFYHLPEYVALNTKHEDGTPVAFYAEIGQAAFLVPLLIRKIPASLGAPDGWYDATTPYGYPAPLLIPPDNSSCLEKFLESFREVGARSGIITAFFRLHPLLDLPLEALTKYGTLVQHGQTVYIDLSLSLEEIEAQRRKDHRKDIRKLMREGFQARINDWSLYEEFIAVYQKTMQRLSASDFYMFSESYFADLRSSLGDRLNLCTVLSPEGEVASAILFTAMNGIVETYLSGTSDKYFRQGPSKLEIDTICRWAKENGNSVLHLGGGFGARSDSLFYFKSGFSDSRANFHTYRMILDEEKYAKLLHICDYNLVNSSDACDFFPIYRTPSF